jgi:hypothetical protein
MALVEGRVGAPNGKAMVCEDADEFGGDIVRDESLETLYTLEDDLRDGGEECREREGGEGPCRECGVCKICFQEYSDMHPRSCQRRVMQRQKVKEEEGSKPC